MEETLNKFLLANIPEILTQEEFDEVKKAIFSMLKENKKLKQGINQLKKNAKIDDLVSKEYYLRNQETINYVKDCLEHLCTVDEIEILNKLGYNDDTE